MSKKLSFAAAARQLGVSVDEVRDCVVDERVVTPVRVTMTGEPIPFDFSDLVIGDKVTEQGIILATINLGGDIYKQNWVTVEAGKLMLDEPGLEAVRQHLQPVTATVEQPVVSDSSRTENEAQAQLSSLSWRAHAWGHVVGVLKTSKASTAKNLYDLLVTEARGVEVDSPFRVDAAARNKTLIVRATGKTMETRTLQNAWSELRAAAKQKT